MYYSFSKLSLGFLHQRIIPLIPLMIMQVHGATFIIISIMSAFKLYTLSETSYLSEYPKDSACAVFRASINKMPLNGAKSKKTRVKTSNTLFSLFHLLKFLIIVTFLFKTSHYTVYTFVIFFIKVFCYYRRCKYPR